MSAQSRQKILNILTNYHLWILIGIFIVLVLLHYSVPLGELIPYEKLGLTRHTVDRVLFLIPITYSAIAFGLKGGIICLLISLAIMLPRALIISTDRVEAIIELTGVIVVGLLINGWFGILQRERKRHQQTIAQLERTQNELSLDRRRLDALNSISRGFNQILDLQQALYNALQQIVEVMKLDIALVFILNKDGKELILHAYYGITDEFADSIRRIDVKVGLSGRVALTGEPLIVADIGNDPRLNNEIVTKERVAAQLIVPVGTRDQVTGTLAVSMHEQRRFTSDEIDVLMAIGDEIGMALENNRLYNEQLFLTEQLKQSEKDYRELFEKAHDAIWVHDMDGNVLTANEAAAELVGYRFEELRKMNVKSFLTEESMQIAKEVRRKLLAHEPLSQPYEQKMIKRDGSEASLMLTTSVLTRNGEVQAFQHIARDVTEQKRMDENLRFYVQQITRAQEEERKRIARELHDDTAQQLIVLSRQLDELISFKGPAFQDPTLLEKLSERVDAILDGVRRFSQDLRPSILDDLGLIPALEWLASETTEHFDISVGVEVIGAERRFTPEKELLLFRIVQEALSNVRKHSGAQRAWVRIEFATKKTILTVKDGGHGFKLPEHLSDLTSMSKLGLAGMAERAKLLGGELHINSEPGKGTAVVVEIPA